MALSPTWRKMHQKWQKNGIWGRHFGAIFAHMGPRAFFGGPSFSIFGFQPVFHSILGPGGLTRKSIFETPFKLDQVSLSLLMSSWRSSLRSLEASVMQLCSNCWAKDLCYRSCGSELDFESVEALQGKILVAPVLSFQTASALTWSNRIGSVK